MSLRSSIFVKFLCVQVPAFLIAIVIGVLGLIDHRIERGQEQFSARIGAQVARVGSLVSNLDLVTEKEEANKLLGLLLADPGIECVDLLNGDSTLRSIAAPRQIGCLGAKTDQFLSLEIHSVPPSEIRVGLSAEEISQIRRDGYEFGSILGAMSVLIAALAAAISFRRVVSLPISRLLAGIRVATTTGRTVRVENGSPDEIGTVIAAFNTMQEKLREESDQVRAARDHVEQLYNATPALLFTMSNTATLLGVSDFWLEATGYSRSEVVGQNMSMFLSGASRQRLKSSLLGVLDRTGEVRDIPLQIWRRNGSEMEVSFSAIAEAPRMQAVACFVCVMSDVTMLKTAEIKLREMAMTDSLTKLPNRASLIQGISELVETPPHERGISAIMLIDLDNFKWVNDTLGHAAGDQLLIDAARRLKSVVRPGDMVARLGGDEFAIMCRLLDSKEEVQRIANAIVEMFVPGFVLEGAVGYVNASIGIAYLDRVDIKGAELLRQADQAMYAAKHAGKRRHAIYQSAGDQTEGSKNDFMRQIEQGLANGWFRLHFQPIIDLSNMRVVGVEALLRVQSPLFCVSNIEALIRVAEQSGQMDALGRWVLEEAARNFQMLSAKSGNPDFYISVNLSAVQIHEGFLRDLKRVFIDFPAARSHFVLEVTETAAIKRFDLVNEILTQARACGTRIAIDDFGKGYSSMSYISRLPVDIIKIDRSYISAFDANQPIDDDMRKRQALVRAAVTLGNELGISMVAEGIETDEVSEAMRNLGLSFGQGYNFCRPMPADAAADWISSFANRKFNKTPTIVAA